MLQYVFPWKILLNKTNGTRDKRACAVAWWYLHTRNICFKRQLTNIKNTFFFSQHIIFYLSLHTRILKNIKAVFITFIHVSQRDGWQKKFKQYLSNMHQRNTWKQRKKTSAHRNGLKFYLFWSLCFVLLNAVSHKISRINNSFLMQRGKIYYINLWGKFMHQSFRMTVLWHKAAKIYFAPKKMYVLFCHFFKDIG